MESFFFLGDFPSVQAKAESHAHAACFFQTKKIFSDAWGPRLSSTYSQGDQLTYRKQNRL
jgi:hypothetical protein